MTENGEAAVTHPSAHNTEEPERTADVVVSEEADVGDEEPSSIAKQETVRDDAFYVRAHNYHTAYACIRL